MAGVYRPRHPERTVLYRVLFHYFDQFLADYENRFEREYGFLRPIIKQVVERYLDCGNPRCGFARIRCPDCHAEHLVMFSCRTRGFCPSCHAKRLEEWGEWMREELLLDVPHRQVVFTIIRKKLLSPEWAERLLSWTHTGFNVHSRVRAKTRHEAERVGKYMIRPLLSLERLCLDEREARVTSHIPDKGQVTVRYYGLYANPHRGKVKKASLGPFPSPDGGGEAQAPPFQGLGRDDP